VCRAFINTPAMATGISKTLWGIADIATLIPDPVPMKRGSYKKIKDLS